MVKKANKNKFALVLSGGGARGAYEAGVIHYVRTVLAPKNKIIQNFDVYCGSSVGAINTCYCAARDHISSEEVGNGLYHAWRGLRQENIYERNLSALTGFIARSTIGMTTNLFRKVSFLPNKKSKNHFGGLFNTKPLPQFLQQNIDFKKLNENVEKGPISAVSITATNLDTGYMELFVKKKKSVPYTGEYVFRETEITEDHPMASGAIPIAFPARQVGKYWYCDGGLRLNTPMSPAIQLGANRIFIIGLHNIEERKSLVGSETNEVLPPTLGEIVGKVFHSIFLDRIQYDLEQLERINKIIHWGELTYGDNFLEKINKTIENKKFTGDVASRGLQDIKCFCIHPSKDVRKVFAESLEEDDESIGGFEKLLLKILDVDLIQGQDFLSYLLFTPSYIYKLIELGYQDAKRKRDEILEFLSTQSS